MYVALSLSLYIYIYIYIYTHTLRYTVLQAASCTQPSAPSPACSRVRRLGNNHKKKKNNSINVIISVIRMICIVSIISTVYVSCFACSRARKPGAQSER